MEQPLVSVVIPVFNIEAHLEQCLDSVVGQTLREIEMICVDDGSTDSSPQILERYAQQDSRVRVITQANAGPGAARNTGLAEAAGIYLIFLDSDDWFEPDFLERMVERAEETGADVTICCTVEFDTATGRELPSEWMLKSQYLPSETFSPSEVAEHIFQFTYGWPWDKLYRRVSVTLSPLGHTWFLDLDGTIVKQNGYKLDGKDTLLDGAAEFITSIPEKDMIIFITSRTDEYRDLTEQFLNTHAIRYDHIIYNAPYGERIVINDRKPSGLNTAIAVATERDKSWQFKYKIDSEA